MSLEQELRRALKRTDPPAGFDDRVLSRIAAGGVPNRAPMRGSRAWDPNAAPALGCPGDTVHIGTARRGWAGTALPIAASLMLAFGATYYVQQQQQRQVRENQAQTEQAARDVVLALQIASEKISAAQARVQEITQYDPKSDY
jgi:uncharacterized protein HemX